MKFIFLIFLLAGCHTNIDGVGSGKDMSEAVDLTSSSDLLLDLSYLEVADLTAVLPDLLPAQPYYFDTVIQQDINAIGCASASCHGTRAPVLVDSPVSAATLHNNYLALSSDIHAGELSLLLKKTLINSGVSHADNGATAKPFADTEDLVYQRWLSWISAGALEH